MGDGVADGIAHLPHLPIPPFADCDAQGGAAALLVFVDSMKELPATLLLRPFNFDTLATQVFTLASLYRYEEAGLSALTIVLVSLAPVLLLHGIIVAGPGALTSRRTAASAAAEGLSIAQ